jgi:hypothetical protein
MHDYGGRRLLAPTKKQLFFRYVFQSELLQYTLQQVHLDRAYVRYLKKKEEEKKQQQQNKQNKQT